MGSPSRMVVQTTAQQTNKKAPKQTNIFHSTIPNLPQTKITQSILILLIKPLFKESSNGVFSAYPHVSGALVWEELVGTKTDTIPPRLGGGGEGEGVGRVYRVHLVPGKPHLPLLLSLLGLIVIAIADDVIVVSSSSFHLVVTVPFSLPSFFSLIFIPFEVRDVPHRLVDPI